MKKPQQDLYYIAKDKIMEGYFAHQHMGSSRGLQGMFACVATYVRMHEWTYMHVCVCDCMCGLHSLQ